MRSVTGLNWPLSKRLCLVKPANYLSLTFKQFYPRFSVKNIVIHQNVHRRHTFTYVDLWPFIFPRWRPQWLGLLATQRGVQDVSYPGRFVPRTFRTQVGQFVPSLDVSYPKSGRFVPKDWTIRTQCFVCVFL